MKLKTLLSEMPQVFGGFTDLRHEALKRMKPNSPSSNEANFLTRVVNSSKPDSLQTRMDLTASKIPNMPVIVTYKMMGEQSGGNNVYRVSRIIDLLDNNFSGWEKLAKKVEERFPDRAIIHYLDSMKDNDNYATIDFMWVHRFAHIWIEETHRYHRLMDKFLNRAENLHTRLNELFQDVIIDPVLTTVLYPIAEETKEMIHMRHFLSGEHIFDMFVYYYRYGNIKFGKNRRARFHEILKKLEDSYDQQKLEEWITQLEKLFNKFYQDIFEEFKKAGTYYMGYL